MLTHLSHPEGIFPSYRIKNGTKVLCDQVHPNPWVKTGLELWQQKDVHKSRSSPQTFVFLMTSLLDQKHLWKVVSFLP